MVDVTQVSLFNPKTDRRHASSDAGQMNPQVQGQYQTVQSESYYYRCTSLATADEVNQALFCV